jgi:paraquat-inducible protein B
MTDAHANISQKRRISPIWFVPILALGLGIWMLIYTIQSQGPEITIIFSTAQGLEAGKTKIKLRNVEIGLVESVGLGEDLESVVVKARLEKDAVPLLREDAEFWVVRPRIGKGGISGLSTVLSGGYIQISPGKSGQKTTDFVGLETPPVTPAGTPGKKLTIFADRAGSVSVGDPILYKGFRVGTVESDEFDIENQGMHYRVFIGAPYDDLVTTSTRFWNVSGFSVEAGADGIKASTGSLETLLLGGLEFGLPEGIGPGVPVEAGTRFELYDSYAEMNERPYRYSVEYVVGFPQSVRGLRPGAPVEYRGLPAGHVVRVMVNEWSEVKLENRKTGRPIPVLIQLEPARLDYPDSEEGVEMLRNAVRIGVTRGMRASLTTGNLITGSLYVAFDLFPNEPASELGEWLGRPTIPTIESGLGGIELRVSRLLDKLNALPLDKTVAELQNTLASLNDVLASEGMQSLPQTLDQTLGELQNTLVSFSGGSELQARLLPAISELDQTLASLRQVLDTLGEQPNALIFNRAPRVDPQPPAGSE